MTPGTWIKSSHSGGASNSCVEVRLDPDAVAVRDSKDADGPRLAFTRSQWTEFLANLRVTPPAE